jgi:hypothetical protein
LSECPKMTAAADSFAGKVVEYVGARKKTAV